MDLFEAGFDTVWEEIDVPSGLHDKKNWEGTRRPYWTIDVSFLLRWIVVWGNMLTLLG